MEDTGVIRAGGRDADSVINQELQEVLPAFSNLDYRDLFWPGRRYEDQCDRIAVRAYLPPRGARIVEVGAGFGRLTDEYGGYGTVALVDPSTVMCAAMLDRVGDDPRFTVFNGHAAALPFSDGSFDAVVCVRVIHHMSDPRPAIVEFARILRPGGVLVLEYANKRNLKEIARYCTHSRGCDSPFASGSVPNGARRVSAPGSGTEDAPNSDSAVPLSQQWGSDYAFRHAPKDICTWLVSAGFGMEGTRSVRLLSRPWITGSVPASVLVGVERAIQPGLGWLKPSPSIVVRAVRGQRRRGARVPTANEASS